MAAAADLRHALDELVAAFRERNPDVEVEVAYGASGGLYAQITGGAPIDLFFSADEAYPRRLAEAGKAVPESRHHVRHGPARAVAPLGLAAGARGGAGGAARSPREADRDRQPGPRTVRQAAEAALRAAACSKR